MSLADVILEQDIYEVRHHLQMGVSLNQFDEYGFTPLIEATIVDSIEIAKLLIDYGANVNMQDSIGGTPIQWAVDNNNIELVKLLLEHGANPNAYNFAGQPILMLPLLRQQKKLKRILINAGASLEFAQDYINAKLLGHMFELVGTADIVDPRNNFVEVDFEGFYLEFSLNIIAESVEQYANHFAARDLRRYMQFIQMIVHVLYRAAHLIKFQQYRIDISHYRKDIHHLLQQEPLLIPVGYEGHAITFVKFGTILVKCDRREESRLFDNIVFYQMNKPELFTVEFVEHLLYEKQTSEFINDELPDLLVLQPITTLKVPAQISGNCSWANVEACIPVIFFLLITNRNSSENDIMRNKTLSLSLFDQWREWNKTRALQFCVQSFHLADSIRKACKAEILAAILYQSPREDSTIHQERIEMILKALLHPTYRYVLQNYIKTYCYESHSEEGKSFMALLKQHGYFDNA